MPKYHAKLTCHPTGLIEYDITARDEQEAEFIARHRVKREWGYESNECNVRLIPLKDWEQGKF